MSKLTNEGRTAMRQRIANKARCFEDSAEWSHAEVLALLDDLDEMEREREVWLEHPLQATNERLAEECERLEREWTDAHADAEAARDRRGEHEWYVHQRLSLDICHACGAKRPLDEPRSVWSVHPDGGLVTEVDGEEWRIEEMPADAIAQGANRWAMRSPYGTEPHESITDAMGAVWHYATGDRVDYVPEDWTTLPQAWEGE